MKYKFRKVCLALVIIFTLAIISFTFIIPPDTRIGKFPKRLALFIRRQIWAFQTERNLKKIQRLVSEASGIKERAGEESFNLLLIVIDTCRSDHLGCYGYPFETTPHIDSMAKSGVLFTRVICQTPVTLPSHCSIMTSLYPQKHGVRDNGSFCLDDSFTTLAEVLQQNGYNTGTVVSSFVLDSRFGLEQGFDFYQDKFKKPGSSRLINGKWLGHKIGIFERTADEVTLEALRWLEEIKKRKFFLWMHYYDPHQPYTPPPRFKDKFRQNLYDGEVAFVDECLSYVFAYLKKTGLDKNTLVVITSDHGESLGEHNYRGHPGILYEQVILIPWIINHPQKDYKGKVISQQVESIDIMPTILHFLNILSPAGIQGESRLDLIEGEKKPARPASYSETLFPMLREGKPELYSVRTNNWKLINQVRAEGEQENYLYDMVNDPEELIDLASRHPALVKELFEKLTEFKKMEPEQRFKYMITMDKETKEKLKALGYIQ